MKYILIAGVVILALFLVVLSQIPLAIEPLTEMYFENHTKLPVYIFPNQSYNFSFTIRNLEYQKMRYYYDVSAFDENETLISEIDSGEFILENNQSSTLFKDFILNRGFARAKVVVQLDKDISLETPEFKKKLWWPDPNYPMQIDIHFWVEEITGPKIIITPD